MWQRIVLISGLLAAHSAAHTQGHTLAAKAGCRSLGVAYTYALQDRIDLRVGFNGSSFGFDDEESGINYECDLNCDSPSVAVDFHPFTGLFRVTGGILSNDNGMGATSRTSRNIAFGRTAPFFGVGWDWSLKNSRFGLTFDLGVVSQSAPREALGTEGTLLGDPLFESDIEAERIELQDSLDRLNLMPFATLGLVSRF